MALVNLTELMKDSEKNNYAIGSYNVINQDMVRGVIKAAEEEKSPVIMSLAEIHCSMAPLEVIGPAMIDAAKRAKVPVVVHLDHGEDFELLIRAMKLGFTSIMFDGSSLSFEENIRQTAEMKKISKSLSVSLEAELGQLLRPEGGGDEEEFNESELDERDFYTDPSQAKEFVEKTELDLLAVAYGTAHGIYLKKPQLDFERLDQIKKITGKPLVMHGGSGLEKNDYLKSIDCGINKINYYSNMSYNVANIIRGKINDNDKKVYYHDISQWAIEAVKEDVANTMRIFRSSGRA